METIVASSINEEAKINLQRCFCKDKESTEIVITRKVSQIKWLVIILIHGF